MVDLAQTPGYARPAGATPRDAIVGYDELGREIRQTSRGVQYAATDVAPVATGGAGGRGSVYNLLDNIIGFDDGVMTPGENLGAGARDFVSGLLSDPLGTGADILRGGYETIAAGMAPGATPMDAMGAAGIPMGAGGLFARPAGSLGIFAGRTARTADLDALERAQRLASEGADRGQIWQDTGWFQGVDGQWRFEIDDSRMIMRQNAANALNYEDRPDYQTNLSNAVLHQPLLGGMFRGENIPAAYDDMWGDVNIGRRARVSGSYMPDTDEITVYAPDSVEGRSVMLHELQHAIQNREGFSRGSNPGEATTDLLLEQTARLRELSDAMDAREAELGLSGYRPETNDATLRQLREQYDSMVGRTIPDDEVLARYRSSSGETEARNVQTRANFTQERRRAIPPWETMDVPEADQIVRYNSANRSTATGLLATQAGGEQDPLANLRDYVSRYSLLAQ